MPDHVRRSHRAVFVDRDGVLIEDVHLLTRPDQLRLLAGVPKALVALKSAGFKLILVSNQTVVARGLCSESDVEAVNADLQRLIQESPDWQKTFPSGATRPIAVFDAIQICPHHPSATLEQYRQECECRKPRPGMLIAAARELSVELPASFAVGDRITDIIAGASAGCRTILVQTGRHLEPPIQSSDPIDHTVQADHIAKDLAAATNWILQQP